MRWVLQKTNDEYLTYLSKKTGISRTLAQILINRGIKEPSQVKDFLNPSLSLLSDPFQIYGMEDAVLRIRDAIKNNERILIHGDYDADGLTATAMMVEGLRRLGADVHFFIPSRHLHGYGFNEPGLRRAKELGAALIITVDCGIKSFETARKAKDCGIDLIITDHHLPYLRDGLPVLPPAVSVVNPGITSPPNSESFYLSGAGIAFRLLEAVYGRRDEIEEFLDLVTLGTVGDIVPLKGENRYILKQGLEILKGTTRPGIRALLEVSGMAGRDLTPSNLSFTLIPRLNAPGRMGSASEVVNLLLTSNESEAEGLAVLLDNLNRQRQTVEEEVYEEAQEFFRAKYNEIPDAIVLYKENWHPGVIGIVASRFQEEFYRPVFIFSIKDGIAIGSVRSIPEINIIDLLHSLEGFFIRYGGHRQAAGLRMHAKDLRDFEAALIDRIQHLLIGERPVPLLRIDAEVSFNEINFSLVRELQGLEPLGYGNEEPILGAKNLQSLEARVVGSGHLKLRLRQGGNEFDVIGFSMAELIDLTSGPVDIAFSPAINDFNGKRSIQLRIRAIRRSSTVT